MRRAGSRPCARSVSSRPRVAADAVEQRVADELHARQPAARRGPARTGTRPRADRPAARSCAPGRAATPTPAGRCSRGPARPPLRATRARRRLNSGKSIRTHRSGLLVAQAAGQRAVDAHERAQASHALDDADGRDLARVGDGVHARRAQLARRRARTPRRRGAAARSARSRSAPCRSPDASPATSRTRRGGGDAQRLRRFAGVAHPTRAACAARTSVSTLSRITCGDLERAQPVPSGDRRRLPRAHGLHERVDLLLERVALAHLELLEGERRLARRRPARAGTTRTRRSSKSIEK